MACGTVAARGLMQWGDAQHDQTGLWDVTSASLAEGHGRSTAAGWGKVRGCGSGSCGGGCGAASSGSCSCNRGSVAGGLGRHTDDALAWTDWEMADMRVGQGGRSGAIPSREFGLGMDQRQSGMSGGCCSSLRAAAGNPCHPKCADLWSMLLTKPDPAIGALYSSCCWENMSWSEWCARRPPKSRDDLDACRYGTAAIVCEWPSGQYGSCSCRWSLRDMCCVFPDSDGGQCMRACLQCARSHGMSLGVSAHEDCKVACRDKGKWEDKDDDDFVKALFMIMDCSASATMAKRCEQMLRRWAKLFPTSWSRMVCHFVADDGSAPVAADDSACRGRPRL